MLIDNEQNTIHEWLATRTLHGNFYAVTGYFTVGAFAWLARQLHDKIQEFKFILGNLVAADPSRERTIDLLAENLIVADAFSLNQTARAAVDFISQSNVHIKTLEPNFCHAKVYLFECEANRTPDCWFISGSSNLTEAGLGLKKTHNVELNTLGQGTHSDYRELREWFDSLWRKPQAHTHKTVAGKNIDLKEYLISEIRKIFRDYTPLEIYYKILYELFGSQILQETADPRFSRQVGRLETSVIFNSLYEFQQKGALSLIRMLQKLNGAVLADAVGLGKTWTALAVIKFFQLEGYEVILLCPKKLDHNWRQYLVRHNSRFEDDHFDYVIRYHTDLQNDRLEGYTDGLKIKDFFRSDRPKLFVIDESHNLRNDKSSRYRCLVDRLLNQDSETKVLMLSATPINNSLLDIRNQFKLITRGESDGFIDSLGVRNLDHTFAQAQRTFNQWRANSDRNIRDLINGLQPAFFKITDSLIVARTRTMIESEVKGLQFPLKEKPDNVFVTPRTLGNFESFEELLDHFPPTLSAYQPSFYTADVQPVKLLDDQKIRDQFLVKMMYILLVKRLESSWYSFKRTVEKILHHHQDTLDLIRRYEHHQADASIEYGDVLTDLEDNDEPTDLTEFTIGKRQQIKIADIDSAGKLAGFKHDLKNDVSRLDGLLTNLNRFETIVNQEITHPQNHTSVDTKLQTLIRKIKEKRASGSNHNNPKVLIFTAYKDTAFYLFEQLRHRGFSRIAVVTGDESRTSEDEGTFSDFEPILERFAPFTKLFLEKRWSGFTHDPAKSPNDNYLDWQQWLGTSSEDTATKLAQPIDILIASDCLSEGQNLQDCDFVVNYDIHWNPVRAIQRMGRIDRLGSPNETVYGLNFWPTDSINKYLDLQSRVEDRMTAMKLAGAEVDSRFTDRLRDKTHDAAFEQKLTGHILEQMQVTWDDIELSEQGLGFDDLSLERFRQDLVAEIERVRDLYEAMPKGIYSGFSQETTIEHKSGIIALLGYPARPVGLPDFTYTEHDLIFVDYDGKAIMLNQREVLDLLARCKHHERVVPAGIDAGETSALHLLSTALHRWLANQASQQDVQAGEVITTMGQSALDILHKLKSGDPTAVKTIRRNVKTEHKYDPTNCDLLVWVVVS